ncbi:phage tail-collar fiber family protein [Clostridium botulinum 202F]|nr:phage tail-collar fiber family protein [Clostridium botulinum 202F]
MAEKFYSILTNIGKAKVANSIGLGTKINFAKMKVGDGGGTYYEPTESQIDLKHTVWEGNINHVTVDEKNPNWIHIEVMIPSTVGGFTIREYGAFDDENNLIGICKCAETYKPVIADGSTKELLLDLILCVVNTDTVELKIDPTIIFAKKGEVEQLRTDITAQLKDIAKKTDKFTEDSNGKLLYNNNKVGATKAKELELETIPGMNAKDVQAGIAEVFQGANNFISYKQGIAGVVGSPVTGTQNKNETVNSIQGIKNNAASALKAKNIDASGNEALASLVSKIANISIQGMGGKKFLGGVINHTNGTRDEIFLNFNAGAITIDQPNSSYSQYPYVCVTKVGGSFYPFQSSNSVSGIYYDSTKKILSISSSVSTGNFPFNAWGE